MMAKATVLLFLLMVVVSVITYNAVLAALHPMEHNPRSFERDLFLRKLTDLLYDKRSCTANTYPCNSNADCCSKHCYGFSPSDPGYGDFVDSSCVSSSRRHYDINTESD
jgi:hypothetical protein